VNHAPVQVLYNWRIEIRFQVGKRNSSYLYSHRIGHVVHSTAHPIGRGIPLTTLKWTDGRTDLRLVLRINGAAPPLQRISSVVMFNYMEVNDFFFSKIKVVSHKENRSEIAWNLNILLTLGSTSQCCAVPPALQCTFDLSEDGRNPLSRNLGKCHIPTQREARTYNAPARALPNAVSGNKHLDIIDVFVCLKALYRDQTAYCRLNLWDHVSTNIQKFHFLPTQCSFVFCMDLRTNSDYSPIQP